ncbi:MAG: NTE family protein [Limisphaerales bacterium]|jgi:NTE family protein
MPTPKNIKDFAREYRNPGSAFSDSDFQPAGHGFLENVSTFISTSPEIHDLAILERLAATVHQVTNAETLFIRVVPAEAGEPARDWSPLNSFPHHRFAFTDQLRLLTEGVQRLFVRVNGTPYERKYLTALIGHCARHFERVLVHVNPEAGDDPVTECVRRARHAYALLRQNERSFELFREYNSWFKKRGKARRFYLKPVLCLGVHELPQTHEDTHRVIGTTVHFYQRDCPMMDANTRSYTGSFEFDLRRWSREIGACRIGLALSSGGAKGFAYVGVIQVLEEAGIEIDMIAGCSMGAYIGALWAAGHDGSYIRERALELQGRWGLWKILDPVLPPRRGFIAGRKIKRLLMESIGESQFCDMLRPLKVIAANLNTLEKKIFDSGEVASAVQASIAIPGVCAPVEIDGESYIDGGVVDPLPVDILREAGIERVIGVNTVPTTDHLRRAREREQIKLARLDKRPWWSRLFHRQFNYFASGNILDIIQQSFIGSQIPNAEEACRHADVVLRPINYDGTWHDFNKPRKYIALGRRVALEHLEELKALTQPTEKRHEYEPTANALASIA